MVYYVYILADPRNNEVFYVGITSNISIRFQAHMKLRGNNAAKNTRIRNLQEENVIPCIEIIETLLDEATALVREKYWIHHFSQQGSQLTNIRLLKKTINKQPPKQKSKPALWNNVYKAKQATEVLGVSSDAFRRLIKEGKVRPIVLCGLTKRPV